MNGINNFIAWVFSWLFYIIEFLIDSLMLLIVDMSGNLAYENVFLYDDINIALFSDVIIWSGKVYDLVLFILILLFTFIGVRLIWRLLRKIFRKLFFWDRW